MPRYTTPKPGTQPDIDPDRLIDNWDKLTPREKQVGALLTLRFSHPNVTQQHKNWQDYQQEFQAIYGAYQEALRRGDPSAEEDYQQARARSRARWRHREAISPGGLHHILEAWQGLRVPDPDCTRELEASLQGRFTRADVARMLGITRGRVTQIVHQIELKLGRTDNGES